MDKLARIVLICPTRTQFHLESEVETGLGGIEAANIALAAGLASLGHEVTLLSRTDRVRTDGVLVNAPLEHLADIEASKGIDVAISSNDAISLASLRASALKVVWWHNPFSLIKLARRRQVWPVVQVKPIAVFGGHYARQQMSAVLPFCERHVIDLGLNPLFLAGAPDWPRQPWLVFASQAQRGLAETLTAWRQARPMRPAGCQLHIFGTLGAQMGIDDTAAERDAIVFHGRVTKDEMIAFYREASLMIVPGAHDETFCLAAAEAQAMGMPVVTLGIGALSERVQHDVNGLIVRSHAEMVRAALTLLANADQLSSLRRGAESVRHRYGWPRVAREWDQMIERARASQRSLV